MCRWGWLGNRSDPCSARVAQYIVRMATNLDVDIAAIEELMRLGGFRSKREAVDAAVREALAYRRQLKAVEFLATIDFRPVLGEEGRSGPAGS